MGQVTPAAVKVKAVVVVVEAVLTDSLLKSATPRPFPENGPSESSNRATTAAEVFLTISRIEVENDFTHMTSQYRLQQRNLVALAYTICHS